MYDETLEQLLLAARQGDPDALLIAQDRIEETGATMLLEVGRHYLVMTLTHYWCGLVTESTPSRTVLEMVSWIPQTGRLSDAITSGELEEVEPLPDDVKVPVNTGHITNGIEWNHPLPRKRKPA